MSKEEQMAAIGHAVSEAADSKKRVELLKGELETLSKLLEKASHHINGIVQGIENPEWRAAVMLFPPPEKVRAACEEFQNEKRRAIELATRVKSLGI